MNKIQEIQIRANKKQIPLILSLVAAVKKHGASVEDFDFAYTAAKGLLERRLVSKPLTEFCDDIETALKSI